MRAFVIGFFTFITLPLMAQSFESGTDLQTVRLRGEFTLRCTGQTTRTKRAYCRGEYLIGGSHQYFLYDTQGKKVDQVVLKGTYPSGKEITKTKDFDWQEGRTDRRVNLWIETLFQRALLDYGNNRVQYTLSYEDGIVSSGEFNVNVSLKEERTCGHDWMWSSTDRDCDFPERLCDRYFARNNDCR